jgi:hypothetical protein
VTHDQRAATVQINGDILSFHGSSPSCGAGWFCRHELR